MTLPPTPRVERIRTTHAGALPRSDALRTAIRSRAARTPYDADALAARLREEVAQVVSKQLAIGLDSVNDGELGKVNFTHYCRERLAGFEVRTVKPGEGHPALAINGREIRAFPEYFSPGGAGHARFERAGLGAEQMVCVGPLEYVGQAAFAEDVGNFRAALAATPAAEAFLPANTPGTIEHWLRNEHYPNEEAFLYAIADCMREEYEAIVGAGFLLQIDDPDLADGWQMYPDMSIAEYRRYATLRIDALNHALARIPRERIRMHMCWGSFHGPHKHDVPLADIVDLVFRVKAGGYSIEASNPVHAHEWQVFETARLPDDAVLIPGVIGHYSDFIEHPDLVAERLLRYANLVGRERVMAGTDCGIGPRVGHPRIAWAKLEAMVEGARRATRRLWGRAA